MDEVAAPWAITPASLAWIAATFALRVSFHKEDELCPLFGLGGKLASSHHCFPLLNLLGLLYFCCPLFGLVHGFGSRHAGNTARTNGA